MLAVSATKLLDYVHKGKGHTINNKNNQKQLKKKGYSYQQMASTIHLSFFHPLV